MNVASVRAVATGPRANRTYFFLSYAHSVPLSVEGSSDDASRRSAADADPVIAEFFRELSDAVAERARLGPGTRIGFFDQEIPVDVDIKGGVSAALSAAEVLVPLYSPGYLTKSWPQRELEAFRRRLRSINADVERHIIPVLWTPIPDWEEDPNVVRAVHAAGATPEYVENGLRALRTLRTYRASYDEMLAWLAAAIVEVAENSPLGPSSAPNLDEISLDEVTGMGLKEANFLVAVFGSDSGPTPTPTPWRSYADPIARHAAGVAERLGLRSRVADITEAESLFERIPGIVLIDPWLVVTPGADSLADRLRSLPTWALPIVLENTRDHSGPADTVMRSAVAALKEAVRGRLGSVTSGLQVEQILPTVAARARRAYLKHVQLSHSPGGSRRPPRLGDVADWPMEEGL